MASPSEDKPAPYAEAAAAYIRAGWSGDEQLLHRLVKFIDARGIYECWPWIGVKSSSGYGHIKIDGKDVGTHRLVWAVINGYMPSRFEFVCHHCDNPPCANPTHLFLTLPGSRVTRKPGRGEGDCKQCTNDNRRKLRAARRAQG